MEPRRSYTSRALVGHRPLPHHHTHPVARLPVCRRRRRLLLILSCYLSCTVTLASSFALDSTDAEKGSKPHVLPATLNHSNGLFGVMDVVGDNKTSHDHHSGSPQHIHHNGSEHNHHQEHQNGSTTTTTTTGSPGHSTTTHHTHTTPVPVVPQQNSSAVSPQHHHHHQWGKHNSSCHHHSSSSGSDPEHHGHDHNSTSCDHEHEHSGNNSHAGDHDHEHDQEKVSQILWDIFVEGSDDSDEHDDHSEHNDVEDDDDDHDADDPEDDDESLGTPDVMSSASTSSGSSSLEHTLDPPGASNHRLRRSVGSLSSNWSTPARAGRRSSPHPATSSSSKRSKTSKSSSSSSSSVGKYNEYMDVVLKRMNGMIKTKRMDPLMVNLFSGNNNNNNEPRKGHKKKKKKKNGKKDQKKKRDQVVKDKNTSSTTTNQSKQKHKKSNNTVRKKRKGAKARMEVGTFEDDDDDHEHERVHDNVELDNDHDNEDGQETMLVRKSVFAVNDEEEENEHETADDDGHDDDDDDDVGGEVEEDEDSEHELKDAEVQAFRDMRALIVNGSMRRSSSGVSPSNSSSPDEATKESVTRSKPHPSDSSSHHRGFDSFSSHGSSSSSEEDPPPPPPKKLGPAAGKQPKNHKPDRTKSTKKSKTKSKNQKPTRGVLKGLSSLRRSGNVDVIKQSDKVRVVRSKFLLGPVTLEIVPKTKHPEQRNGDARAKKPKETPPSPSGSKVTAVAQQLKGIIEVRLKKSSPTTIKRLRVFPPKSVKIKPPPNPQSSSPSTSKSYGSSVPRYRKVTPVATHRLRQIASAVVRQADVHKSSGALSPLSSMPARPRPLKPGKHHLKSTRRRATGSRQ